MPISQNLYKTIINAELWFSSPTYFNDPFDCKINDNTEWTDDNIRDHVKRISKMNAENVDPEMVVQKNKEYPGSFSQFFANNFQKVISDQGVTCFTTKPGNLLMWSHYADSHKGVCIAFDVEEDPDLFELTFNVKYFKEYPKFDYLSQRADLVKLGMLSKSDHWEYEDEIRVLKKKNGLHPFKNKAIKEIIFGCKTDQKEIDTIKKLISSSNYPDVKFKIVKLLKDNYGTEIIDL